MKTVIGLLLVLAPGAFLFAIVVTWFLLQGRKKKAPFTEKLLRAPGESLRREIERLESGIVQNLLLLLIYGPAWWLLFLALAAWRKKSPHPYIELMLFLAVFGVVSAFVVWRLIHDLKKWANNSLGLRGERAVGEELNKLMLDGCFVFHDVPGKGSWNIDHVVVAPTGVFAIETKTRRKRIKADGKADYEITFKNHALKFPDYEDKSAIVQAVRNAEWLGEALGHTLAKDKPIAVTPILVFPGWLVTTRSKPEPYGLRVLNPKNLRAAIVSGNRPFLDDKQRRQMASFLEERCRDVEF